MGRLKKDWPNGKCAKCGLAPTPEGHDPCLGELSGVLFACCGHGNGRGYIYFESGQSIRFNSSPITVEHRTLKEVAEARKLKESDAYKAFRAELKTIK